MLACQQSPSTPCTTSKRVAPSTINLGFKVEISYKLIYSDRNKLEHTLLRIRKYKKIYYM